ncbi:MAG: hypothetical protein ACPG8W_08190, partial [Candidatus Promineifilaceae bacterium]
VVSLAGTIKKPLYLWEDEDIRQLSDSQTAWKARFSGSTIGLTDGNSEDIAGMWLEGKGKTISNLYLTTNGAYTAEGSATMTISGDGNDIFMCKFNAGSDCALSVFWDGGGLEQNVNGFAIGR